MEKEVVISYLETARETWLESRHNADRAGHNSAALNALETRDMAAIGTLLDELQTIGAMAVEHS